MAKLGLFTIEVVKRAEVLKFTLDLKATQLTLEDKEKIEKLFQIPRDGWTSGDTLRCHDSIQLEYFGKAIEHIQLMIDLFDKAAIKDVTTTEMRYGISLVQELLLKLETLENKLEKQKIT